MVQFDEKWSFVFKKQEHCNPDDRADDHYGDWWDHVALDPESWRLAANCQACLAAAQKRELGSLT